MADADDVALASLGVKVNVTPFNFDDTSSNVMPEKESAVDQMPYSAPSGLDSLKRFVNCSNNSNIDADHKSKDLLRKLLDSHNVNVSPQSSPSIGSNKQSRYNQLLLSGESDGNKIIASRDVSIRGLSDRAVAELTCESRTSLFGSILRLFDMDKKSGSKVKNNPSQQPPQPQQIVDPMIRDEPILSTTEIVRTVHLTASPGDIPAGMDSKEYTQAALHFLSSYVPFISENESEYRKKENGSSSEGWEMLRKTLPVLPLIKAINPNESLEKRSYGRVRPLIVLGQRERKEYPDSVDSDLEFRRKVLNLERLFTSSLPFPMKKFEPFAFQKYVPRRKLVPRIEGGGAKEELTLMISGHMQQPTPRQPKASVASSVQAVVSMPLSSPAASSSNPTNVTSTPTTGEKSVQSEAKSETKSEAKPSSEELNTYMDNWVAKHAPINLMPSLKQKETIIQETGVDKKRLESWFYRARKKMKRTQTEAAPPSGPPVTKAYSELLAATQAAAPSTPASASAATPMDSAASLMMLKGNVTKGSNEDASFKL